MIVGAAAVLAGFTRQTYSIAVIMLETTQSINLFLPILIAILVSTSVGNLFNKSVYQVAIEIKQIPVLQNLISFQNQFARASEVMSVDVKSLPVLVSVADIYKALITKHTSFPVVTNNNVLIGTISTRMIKIIVVKEMWAKDITKSQKVYSLQQRFSSPQGDLVSSKIQNDWASSSDDSMKVSSARSHNSHASFESFQLKRNKVLQESRPPKTLDWQQLVLD